MAIHAVFTTHVGLVLRWEDQTVVLDNVADPSTPAKVLLGPDQYTAALAKECFEAVKAHYEERARLEGEGQTKEASELGFSWRPR